MFQRIMILEQRRKNMKFTELRKESEAHDYACLTAKNLRLPEPQFEIKTRQRINLSDHACSILLQDMDAFYHQLNIERGSGMIDSAVINHIIGNFQKDADASVYLSCEKKREQLDVLLSGLEKSLRQQAIAHLIEDHRKAIETQVRRDLSRKGTSFAIRINKKNLLSLGRETFPDWNEYLKKPAAGLYRDKVGNYLKALIEEYARKPYVEREAIFCKKNLEEIHNAIQLGLMLKVITQGRFVQYVRPYAVQTDKEQLYYYLAGYLSSSPDGNWHMGSIRLSAITDCKGLSVSSQIGAEQAGKLETAIQKKGIQFLSDAATGDLPEKIVVKFTKQGKKMYHTMLHLRPMYDGKPNGLIYQFTATQRQAENYFFKFGHDAKILEPQELADKFLRRYESAAKQYK